MYFISVLTAAGAAAAAWFTNRLALKVFGPLVIVYIVPLIEELAKSGLAVLFNASIITVHVSFGLIEGIYDLFYSRKTGIAAGLASLAGHFLYGTVTAWIFAGTGQIAAGILGGYLVHMLWNLIVMRFLVHQKEC